MQIKIIKLNKLPRTLYTKILGDQKNSLVFKNISNKSFTGYDS